MNWIIKQIFYFRYLVLKQNLSVSGKYWRFLEPWNITFQSKSFSDGQWLERLPWYDPIEWPFQDRNTYGIFKQMYGKFYFKARLDGLVTKNQWPAIWMLELNNEPLKTWYYEIDIELFRNHLGFTIWSNPNGPQETAKVVRAMFGSRKLYRKLQSEYHLFLIDWNKEWIRFYINGIKCAQFRNSIHVPMQIICSKISMAKIIVK